jgi:hypothetical protein
MLGRYFCKHPMGEKFAQSGHPGEHSPIRSPSGVNTLLFRRTRGHTGQSDVWGDLLPLGAKLKMGLRVLGVTGCNFVPDCLAKNRAQHFNF